MADRFEKFTRRARTVLQLAQEEAQRFNHNFIGTEHILLGLVREGDGVAARVLNNLGVELDAVRTQVEFYVGRGDRMAMGEIGLTPRAKHVIELAVDEARQLNHHYTGTEHFLLGLTREVDGTAAKVLQKLGVSLSDVRAQVLEVLKSLTDFSSAAFTGGQRFERFTERARRTLQLAQEEADRFNHNYIGTEHILLGLVREGDSVAARVLNNLGIELDKVRSAVEFIIGRGDRMVMGEIGLTPRAKRVIELSLDEARRLNHNYIGTEHLLLGLVKEGEGIAAGVLKSLGVTLEKARAQVIEVLKSSGGETTGTTPSATDVKATEITRRAFGGQEPSTAMLRTLFDYSIWARDQLLPLIEGLGEEERQKADSKGVYGSIHDTLAHMAQSEWLWIERCKGESPLRLPKGEDFPTLASLIDWWNEIHSQAMLFINGVPQDYLDREITYLAPDGVQRTRKVWHMLLQVSNHQTEHRSQVASMLGAMGLEVPPTDLVVYLSQKGSQA